MNKTVLITGASEGIGLELAHIHASEGHRLVLVARRLEKLEMLQTELKGKYGVEVVLLPMDLSEPSSATKILEALDRDGLHIDYLINNAGFGHYGWFVDSPWEKELRMIHLNITTLTLLTKLIVPGMINRGYGRVMNVASTAAFVPGPLMSVYFATKAYVLSFSEAIANELQGTGVTVTALCPGPTRSGFQAAAEVGNSKMFRDHKISSSARVAKFGHSAMMRGRSVAVQGFMNRMMAVSAGIAPRRFIAKVVRRMQEE